VRHVWEIIEVHKTFWWVGRRDVKIPLGRPRRRWQNNIKMNLQKKLGEGGMDRIDLAQDRDRWRALVNAVITLRVP
jgi:hypothetical protein